MYSSLNKEVKDALRYVIPDIIKEIDLNRS